MAYNFNEIRLEKGMYSERGKTFEQTLEALDPNENTIKIMVYIIS